MFSENIHWYLIHIYLLTYLLVKKEFVSRSYNISHRLKVDFLFIYFKIFYFCKI